MNYAKDMQIDENSLDIEWLDQAELALKYGSNWALCKKKFTIAEEKVKVVKAELIKRANENPVACCHKDKPNIADIEAYYRNHPRHKKAKEEWIQAQFELDMAEIAKNEVSFTRKAALENLVVLHGQEYFAGPTMPRNLTLERHKREKQKKADSGVAFKLTRKRRQDDE